MNRIARPRGVLALLVTFALVVFTAGSALAQGATITGRVTNDAGAPIRGATVAILSMNVGTQTSETGTYTFTVPAASANGQQVTLTARFIGFKPIQRQITLSTGSQTQDFALEADPFRLEELIVTGVADATSQRKLSFSVSRVSEEQISQVPSGSPVQALQGKVAGARIGIGTGNPGSEPVVRLRGSTNLSVGGSQPLIIVDGVITQSSLADIDANSIESLEVLKGPAAASFYGSNAANGVINITTKRGQNVADGSTTFLVRSEYGQSGLQRFVPVNKYHHYNVGPGGEVLHGDTDPDGIADNPYPTTGPNAWRNQMEEWMQNGQFYSTNAQVMLRRGNTNVGTSFTIDRNQGILPFKSGQLRRNARINVDQGLADNLDVSISASYGLNTNDYSPGSTAGWFEFLQAPPDIDLKRPDPSVDIDYYPVIDSPSARANPLYSLANSDYNLRRERIIASATGRWRPLDWLRFEGTYGTDRLNSRNHTYNFRGYLSTTSGAPGGGSYSIGTSNNVAYNAQASAIATRTFGELNSTTRLTYLYEAEDNNSLSGNSSNFYVGDIPNIGAAPTDQRNAGSSMSTSRTRDILVSQDFDFRDRYILSALYRRDGSSLFGADERWADYYRVSAAYILSEDFQIPGFDLLKLRAARGTAGLRPGFSWQYETYSLSGSGPNKANLGNSLLRPAEVAENEFGVDFAFLNRFSGSLVYADRKTDGAFLNVPLSLAKANGFSGQWQNAADISANTWEFELSALVVDRPNFTYNLTLSADRTRQQIDRMNRAPFRVNATTAQGQDVFYYAAGEPLGIVYGNKFVRNPQDLLDNPTFTGNVGDYVVNPDGYVVESALRGTPGEMPIKYVDATGNDQFRIGDVNPDFGFGIANTLMFSGFTVYALFDGVQGGDIYNFSKQWMYQDHRHGTQGQGDRPAADRIALGFYASGLYNALNAADAFIEDGSFVKLRELSVSYTINESLLSRIGAGNYLRGAKIALIGRNLYTWTDYSGFDPDVAAGGDFNFRIDGFRYPNFRQISGQIELTF
ncbi:MAG TPA: SusC/RagA family TonB-linked outer membrane protein [Gemmatimonadales bacterium]|nr:SusC/RagA family TonB-linked outer membrane protein [Gemmatimonadales bacterium]